MANNERNALAELAHTLCGVVVDNRCYATVGECVNAMNAIKKARRIIAELAKVQDEEAALFSMKHLNPDEAGRIVRQRKGNCFLRCRAIAAEEGANK